MSGIEVPSIGRAKEIRQSSNICYNIISLSSTFIILYNEKDEQFKIPTTTVGQLAKGKQFEFGDFTGHEV